MQRRSALVFLLVCMLVAAWLRLNGLAAVPPGMHFDEAANGIIASEIAFDGFRPIFIPSYTGKEPLFFYLAAGVMRALGPTPYALRLTAAFIGLLTVAAGYRLALAVWRGRRSAYTAGALTAALMAVAFVPLLFSRLGFRAVTQPLLQALTLLVLLRAARTRRNTLWLTAGVLAGLTAYTYLAARLFPFVLLPFFVPLVATRMRQPKLWRNLGGFALAGLVTLAPLLVYFILHPEAFWVRIAQVAPAAEALSLRESYGRALGMFFLQGDPYVRFNRPGQPLLGGPVAILTLGGWVWTLWRQQRLPAWQRAVLWALLVAPFVMILPTALATNEIVPSNLRAIGVFPLIYVIPAGFLAVLLERLWQPARRWLMLLLPVIILVGGAFEMRRAYFDSWGSRADLFYENDGDLVDVAAFLDARPPTDETIYVAALHYQHPTLAFLSERYDELKWLPESQAFVVPNGPALIVYPHNSPAPAWVAPLVAGAGVETGPDGPDGAPTYAAFVLDEPPELPPANRDDNFGDLITLRRVDVAGNEVVLQWEVSETPRRALLPFVHLEDASGYRWGQAEPFAYPSTQWRQGEQIIQRLPLPSQPGRPAGVYRLLVGLFDPDSGERVPRLEARRFAGVAAVIDGVALPAAPRPERLPEPPSPEETVIAGIPGLTLLGVEAPPGSRFERGELVNVSMWWDVQQAAPSVTMTVWLESAELTPRPVHTSQPFDSATFLITRVPFRLPVDLPVGSYRVRVSLSQGGQELFSRIIDEIEVAASDRSFEVPSLTYTVGVRFGDQIALPGYDLVDNGDGTFGLDLAWQALSAPDADYTVFVQALRPDGTCCAWQADAMPQQYASPTSLWLAGEVVRDRYTIDLREQTPGEYALVVGLYVAETGERLPVGAGLDAVTLQRLTIPD